MSAKMADFRGMADFLEVAEEVVELLDGNGFGEVTDEAGGPAFGNVFLGAKATHGDAFQAMAVAHLLHHLEPAHVGQAEIADDEIELAGGYDLERVLGGVRGSYMMAHAL